eukprot:COSAG02_NODE_3299_length_6989_cov_8.204935_1_plen_214_part_00
MQQAREQTPVVASAVCGYVLATRTPAVWVARHHARAQDRPTVSMTMLAARRVERLTSHLSNSVCPVHGATTAEGGGGTVATLLTERQVKDFIVDGFLVLTPEDLPGGRERFASSFYDKARSIAGPDIIGSDYRSRDETLWEALTPEVNAVLGSSTVRGALTSLLGQDFLAPPGNSLMHVSQSSDQMYVHAVHPCQPARSHSRSLPRLVSPLWT